MSGPPLYTVAYEVQDREAFRAMLARLGIDTRVVHGGDGGTAIGLDRDGMEQLRTWFAEHGDAAQADAIQRALSA